jgi:hypothetical protein
MKIGFNGTVAAIVRQGDYFVTVSSPQGVGFEYAPDGGPNAPVVGAIAARKGRAMFLDAHEASEVLARYGSDAENQLILRMELPGAARGTLTATMSLSDKLEQTIRARSTVAEPTEEFNGTTQEFYEHILLPGGILEPFNSTLRRAISSMPARIPGVIVSGKTRNRAISVHWDIVSDSNPET